MDNLTHSLVGWTLGQAGLKRKTRKGLAALILGANMPDIDVFFGWVPWAPLAIHRGFTHSLVGGVVLMPPLLAGLLWLLDRWQVRRGAEFRSGLAMHFGWLLALSYLGTLTHPLLDWQTTYAVQLLSPVDTRWYHTDGLFIIDVWILLGLAFAIWLSRRRERRGGDWRGPPRAVFAVLVLYIVFNGALTAWAKNEAQMSEPYASPDAIFASPPPAAFWKRELVWRERGMLAWGAYDPLVSPAGLAGNYTDPVPDRMAEPLVRRALATPAMASFARWSVLPFARVVQDGCNVKVIFGDARYGRTVAGNRFRRDVVLANAAPGC